MTVAFQIDIGAEGSLIGVQFRDIRNVGPGSLVEHLEIVLERMNRVITPPGADAFAAGLRTRNERRSERKKERY
ncbi:hypothetical protein GCM10027578_29360 [Spirosoma luteolum]